MKLHHIRAEYAQSSLNIGDVERNPIDQFRKWYTQAEESQLDETNAFTLSTVSQTGLPSSRVVLLKEVSDEGFVFFTNYNSQKSKEIESNPQVSMNFFWMGLQRQVRIQGHAEKISREASVLYFDSRPLESRAGSAASPQSAEIESREVLDTRYNQLLSHPETIKCPEHWGGYLIRPIHVEFWQGRLGRLHDRIAFEKIDLSWRIFRKAP